MKSTPNIKPLLSGLSASVERITRGVPEGKTYEQVTQLFNVGATGYAKSHALSETYSTRSPTETEGTHFKRVAQFAAELVKHADKMQARASDIVREGLQSINERKGKKVDLTPHPLAAEIRQKVSNMTTAERVALMASAIEKNDGPLLGAILNAPGILTGVDETMCARYKEALYAKHAPDEVAEQAVLMESFDTALQAADIVRQVARSFSDPAQLSAIEAGELAVANAAANFAKATI